ncbi:hypothetical protein FGG08_006991 [Glutinoglossum americanum]|uniref:Beta-lactamase/transpeptidase-like protein n=1 Tax=Glutinoglossum americanum TaxID=1670608 RepID=A0A9P8L0G2_9PEZI|nr:hypothetical protein FGG08_006991 [Glutinoglossum americanum]
MYVQGPVLAHWLRFSSSFTSSATQQSVLGEKRTGSWLGGEFDGFVEREIERWHVPGLAVAVVDGERTFAKGYGLASISDNISVTPSTLFYTGSTTKAFTAAAMSLLVDNTSQQISWTTPLSSIIRDDFVLPDPYSTTHITIADALSHRTGMPRHDLSYGGGNATVRDVVRSLRYLPLTAEPRTEWQYCNMMYVAISHAIEVLTGEWLGDFLRTRIWEPLGMRNTFFDRDDALRYTDGRKDIVLAKGYFWNTTKYVEVPWQVFPSVSGAGCTISNVLDYTKWLRAMITRSGPISPAGHEALVASHSIPFPSEAPPFVGPITYGFGWELLVYRGHQIILHSGGVDGFGVLVAYVPRLGFGVVAMGNTGDTAGLAEQTVVFRLLDERLGTPEEERLDWDTMMRQALEYLKYLIATARYRLYPTIPSPPLPSTLQLSSYTGTYFHPAYHNITFKFNESQGRLFANVTDNTWTYDLDLEHISGDYFLGYLSRPAAAEGVLGAGKAEFLVGASGVVGRVGVQLEGQMGDELVWFDRLG